MSDSDMGDEVYQPDHPDGRESAYQADLENSLGGYGMDATLDEGYSPPEKPLGVDAYGTTAREQLEGEALDQRLAEEVPDVEMPSGDGIGDQPGMAGEPVDDQVGDERAGRLVGADEGFPRRTNDINAEDVGIDGGAASAEEAAMHVLPEEGDVSLSTPPDEREAA